MVPEGHHRGFAAGPPAAADREATASARGGDLPRVPVPLRSTFVHFPSLEEEAEEQRRVPRNRSRSAPSRCVLQRPDWPHLKSPEERLGLHLGLWQRPQKTTRQSLQELGVDELIAVLHTYGPEKLGCDEDRRKAESLLPQFPEVAQPAKLRRIHGYLEDVSWSQLVLMIRQLVLRPDLQEQPQSRAAAEYLRQVCEALLAAQLRDAGLSWETAGGGGHSVLSWRMGRLCSGPGLAPAWAEVQRRLGGGETLLLTARPVPLLSEEFRLIAELVGDERCVLATVASPLEELETLAFSCDVLYVAGTHDPALGCLTRLSTLRASLAVLNVCRSERLARSLLTAGVRHVVYWPAAVHDHQAVAFGVAFVQHLFELEIPEAFELAKSGICASEPNPILLFLADGPRRHRRCSAALSGATCAEGVVLELRSGSGAGRPEFAGLTARVLPHTASRGWVKVQVGDECISWRAGHWREASAAPPCGLQHQEPPTSHDAPPLRPASSSADCRGGGAEGAVVALTSMAGPAAAAAAAEGETIPVARASRPALEEERVVPQADGWACPDTLVEPESEEEEEEQQDDHMGELGSRGLLTLTQTEPCDDTLLDQDTDDEAWLQELCRHRDVEKA